MEKSRYEISWARVLICLVAAFVIFAGTKALAAGTLAGTVITNQSTASYTDANSNTYAPVNSNVVSTTVSQVASVSVSPDTANQNALANGTASYSVVIQNTGNGSDTINIAASGLPAGWTYALYVDQNQDGILTAADQVGGVYVALGSSVTLAADQSKYAIAVITPLASAPSDTVGTLTVTATSTFTPSQSDASTFSTSVQAAVITALKSVSSASPLPGEEVTYTITYSNGGSAPGYVAVMSDTLSTGITYKPGTIRLNGVLKTDAGGDDQADFNVTGANRVTVNIGQIDPSTTGTITFVVTVNLGLAEGVGVSNLSSVTYRSVAGDPATTSTITSNSSSFTVAHSAGVDVQPPTYTTNQIPGDLNVHPFTIANTGNGPDTYSISSVGLYWTWTVYNDTNQNGLYDVGVDTRVTDTNSDGTIDSGVMPTGTTKYYVATTTVTGFNGQQGKHTLTVTSLSNGSVKDTSLKFTNIETPLVAITKTVSPTGNQPPGTELTYTLSVYNSGLASAINVDVSDPLSNYLTYVPGTIKIGTQAQSDASDADFGRFDAPSNTVLVLIPAISAGQTAVVTFRATIK